MNGTSSFNVVKVYAVDNGVVYAGSPSRKLGDFLTLTLFGPMTVKIGDILCIKINKIDTTRRDAT